MKVKSTEKLEIPADVHAPSKAKDITPPSAVSINEDKLLDETQKTTVIESEAPAI